MLSTTLFEMNSPYKKWTLVLLTSLAAAFMAYPLMAATGSESGMDWGVMGMQLFGGLALFLFGMEQMADALKAVAGERMKNILAITSYALFDFQPRIRKRLNV